MATPSAKPMTKTQLVATLAEEMGSDKKSATAALDAIAAVVAREVAAGGSVTQQRIEAEAKAAARVEKRNAAKGKAPAPKAPRGDENKISARTKRTAAKG